MDDFIDSKRIYKKNSLSPHCRNHSESWFCFRTNGIAIFIGRFWIFMLATCRLDKVKQHKFTWQNSEIHWLNEEHVFPSFCQNSIRPFLFLFFSFWILRREKYVLYESTCKYNTMVHFTIYIYFFRWKTIRNCMRKPEKTSQIIHISGLKCWMTKYTIQTEDDDEK